MANLHASLVRVAGRGILITGPSGSGKSALVVSLLRAGAREGVPAALVADDRVEIERADDQLIASAPETLRGLIELRGVGLLRLPVAASARVDLVAELVENAERLPSQPFRAVLGVPVRHLQLPPRQAGHTADVILTLLLAGEDALRDERP